MMLHGLSIQIFSFFPYTFLPPPVIHELYWGLDPSEFGDMKEQQRIIKEEIEAEQSTLTFGINPLNLSQL